MANHFKEHVYSLVLDEAIVNFLRQEGESVWFAVSSEIDMLPQNIIYLQLKSTKSICNEISQLSH